MTPPVSFSSVPTAVLDANPATDPLHAAMMTVQSAAAQHLPMPLAAGIDPPVTPPPHPPLAAPPPPPPHPIAPPHAVFHMLPVQLFPGPIAEG